MAFKYNFFASKNHDRANSSADWAEFFASFISNGVFADPSSSCQVVADEGLTVNISIGKLWINGYIGIIKDAAESITLASADATNPRIDRIVARVDLTQRCIILAAVAGTPAATPSASVLTRNDSIYEIGLATITVAANATAITQADITDTRAGNDVCGWVTGLIDQIDTTDLFAQFTAAQVAALTQLNQRFETWFAHLEDELDTNQAANLQLQIDANSNDVTALSARTSALEIKTAPIISTGDGSEFLADDGTYKTITVDTSAQIGDVVQTLRTDLGDNWLLCNGDNISPDDYPDLYTLLPAKKLFAATAANAISGNPQAVLIYGSRLFLFYTDSNGIHVYSTHLSNIRNGVLVDYEKYDCTAYTSFHGARIPVSCGCIVNNYFFIPGTSAQLLYSSGGQSWSCFTGSSYTTFLSVWRMRVINGYLILCCNFNDDGSGVYYGFSYCPTSSVFSANNYTAKKFGYSDSSYIVYGATYGNNKWVFVGQKIWVSETSAISSAFAQKSTSTGVTLYDVAYNNGKFVAVGVKNGNMIVMYTDDPMGDWTLVDLGIAGTLYNITIVNDCFVANGTSSDTTEGAYVVSTDGVNWKKSDASGSFVALETGGTLYSYSKDSKTVYFGSNLCGALPRLSGETYSYIKAKEDTTE